MGGPSGGLCLWLMKTCVCLHVSMGPVSSGALCVRVCGAVPSVFLSRRGVGVGL